MREDLSLHILSIVFFVHDFDILNIGISLNIEHHCSASEPPCQLHTVKCKVSVVFSVSAVFAALLACVQYMNPFVITKAGKDE